MRHRIPAITSLLIATAFFTTATIAFAALPEIKSEGKFMQGKGTKASQEYQAKQAAPFYEYGKGIQVWEMHLIPTIDYSYNWDNNVFLEESGRRPDFYHALDAGVTGELPLGGGQHVLRASYLANAQWFQKHDDQDHVDSTFGLGADLNFVPFTLSVDDAYKKTVDRADTEFTTRITRDENTARALLEIPFASFFLETEVYDLNVDYRLPEDDPFDHHDFTIFQRIGIDAAPSTQLLFEYGYKNIHYYNVGDRDGDANQVALGIRGNLTERIVYQFWGGAQFRIYDASSRPDYNGLIFRSAMQYDITDKSHIILKGDRSPQESTFDNQSFYVRDRIELGWKQQLAERLFFNTNGTIQYNEYSRISVRNNTEKTRRDYAWATSFGLEYFMPNELVSFFGEYKYSARDSNTALLSYDDQTASVGMRSKF